MSPVLSERARCRAHGLLVWQLFPAAAPGILPAGFWELAQVPSLLLFPSLVNGVMVAVRGGLEDSPGSLLLDTTTFTVLLFMDKNWFSV